MKTDQNRTGEDWIKFFRTTEKRNELTPDDRTEIFRTVV